MTTDQLSLEDVQRVTDDLSRLWLRLHRIECRLGLSEEERAELALEADVERAEAEVLAEVRAIAARLRQLEARL